MTTMRVAAVQVNAGQDKAANIERADQLVREAVGSGAKLVLLPEKFNLRGTDDDYRAGGELIPGGQTVQWAAELARELRIDLIAGSIVERVVGEERGFNTSVHLDPDGQVRAVYRKIHLFDVDVDGRRYRESDTEQPGDEIVLTTVGQTGADTSSSENVTIGMSICYDLRFPELYRIATVAGARILTVPANFTAATGDAHWEILLRARAIENQCFVIAAGQCGVQVGDKPSWGHSLIVDPWGTILAQADRDQECSIVADLDLASQDHIRAQLPSLANRAPSTYKWPGEQGDVQ